MDQIQKILIQAGRKDLAQEYYKKVALFGLSKGIKVKEVKDPKNLLTHLRKGENERPGSFIDVYELSHMKWEPLMKEVTEKQKYEIKLDENKKATKSNTSVEISGHYEQEKNQMIIDEIFIDKDFPKNYQTNVKVDSPKQHRNLK